MAKNALIISENQTLTQIAHKFLTDREILVDTIESTEHTLDTLNLTKWDIILFDITQISIKNLNFLTKIKTVNPQAQLITITENEAEEVIVESMTTEDDATITVIQQEREEAALSTEIQEYIQEQLSIKSEPLKRVPIAFLGVQNAGKSTLVGRLITGEAVQTTPTYGLSVEILRVSNTVYQLFDLGGHFFFRQSIWENYVRASRVIVFIFDASDASSLRESREWFWRSVQWLPDTTPIAFLANKCDLECMPLERIIENLELNRLASTPERPFRIFLVSALRGDNVQHAFEWINRQIEVSEEQPFKLQRISLFFRSGEVIADRTYHKGAETEDLEAKRNIAIFLSEVIAQRGGLHFVSGTKNITMYIARGDLLCTLILEQESSMAKARIIGESLMELALSKGDKQIKEAEIDEFLKTRFPSIVLP